MRFESFTWVIYGAYRAGFNPVRAAILSLVLVAIVARGRAGRGRAARARAPRHGSAAGAGADRWPRSRLGPARWPAVAVVVGLRRRRAGDRRSCSSSQWFFRGESGDDRRRRRRAARAGHDRRAWRRPPRSSPSCSPLPVGTARRPVTRPVGPGHRADHVRRPRPARHRHRHLGRVRRHPAASAALPGAAAAGLAYVVLFCSFAVGSIRASIEQTLASGRRGRPLARARAARGRVHG